MASPRMRRKLSNVLQLPSLKRKIGNYGNTLEVINNNVHAILHPALNGAPCSPYSNTMFLLKVVLPNGYEQCGETANKNKEIIQKALVQAASCLQEIFNELLLCSPIDSYKFADWPEDNTIDPTKPFIYSQVTEIEVTKLRRFTFLNQTDSEYRLNLATSLLESEKKFNEKLTTFFECNRDFLQICCDEATNEVLQSLYDLHKESASFITRLQDIIDDWELEESDISLIYTDYPYALEYYITVYFNNIKKVRANLSEECAMNLMQRSGSVSGKPALEALIFSPLRRLPQQESFTADYPPASADCLDKNPFHFPKSRFHSIIERRNKELGEGEIQFRIVQIQGKFPHDKLDLDLSLEEQERNSRRFTSQSSHSPSVRRKNPNLAPEFEFERKPSSDDLNYGGTSPSSQKRLYIQEGAVKLSSTTSTNERYIFLFHDLLLLSKVKSTSSYKLKEKVRVSEVWLSPNIDEVAEATLSTDKSFTIGWPTTNYVATFCSPEEKELWYKALQKCIDDQLESIEPKELSINITNKCNADDTTSPQTATLSITSRQDVKTVIKMAQEHFQIQPEEQYTYQLWISAKDIPHSLLGHERPYAIKANFARMLPDVQGNTVRDDNEHQQQQQQQEMGLNTLETSCQFFLKKNKQGTGRINLDLNNSQRRWKNPMKKSPIYNWAMNKKTIKYQPSLYDNVSPGKLFGNPLTALSTEEELVPSPVQNILVELFRRGPGTTGIFRKSALQRTAKQIRQNLDAGKEENFEDISIIVLASVLKDFFRSLPDCLLVSALYDNFVGTKSTTENETRVEEIKKILPFLPREHYETLMRLICVLYHIQRFSDRNNMNSYNLSICISQSIMWPPTSSKLEATEQTSRTSDFVCFLIDNYVQVFGADNEFLLGQESEIQFNEGAGEDSDSGTDQHVYSLRQDTEEENNDSEKENELPLSPSDSVFTPTKGDLDSPFAHSDSSICTNDSDDRETRVSQESGSLAIPSYQPAPRSTPSSPLHQRREMDDSINVRNMSDVSDYEITDYNEIFQRKLLRQPRHKRVLSSTTTSAELIEHKRHAEANDRKASRKKSNKISFSSENLNKNSNNSDKGTSEIVPKKYVISQPVIKHFTTEYANSPNVIFHSVDRRRQPAAPSYEEHIQRTQASKNATVTNIVRKKSIPPSKVQQLSVEDYRPSLLRSEYDIDYKNEVKLVESVEPVVVPVVSVAVGNKTESTSKVENASVIDDNKTEVSQTNPPKAELQNSPKSELQNATKTELQSSPKADSPKVDLENAPKKDFQKDDNSSDCSKPVTSKNTNLTKLNTHKSPNRVDSLIEAFQVKCAPNNVKEAQSALRNQIRAAVNKINSLDNFDIAPVFLERDAKEIEQSNNARRSDSPLMKPSPVAQQENVKVASIVLNERDSRPKKDFVEEVIEASTHDSPQQNPLDVIDPLKMSLDETLSESTSDNDTVVEVLPSPQKPKLLHDNNNDTNEFDRNTIETSDLIEENNLTLPSSEGPFTLKLKAEVRKTPAIALPELQKSQSLQLKKTCLTQAPKKIDQLTTKNVMVKEESPRAISARELRRTNRRLKNEIRNAFNDGNFTFYKQDALANRFLVNGGTRTAPVVWKCGEKENVFNKKKLRYNDTIGRLQSKSILSHDESYV